MTRKQWIPASLITAVIVGCIAGASFAAAPAAVPAAPAKKAEPAKPKAPKAVAAGQAAKTLFNFEGDMEGWKIPSWALVKSDNAGLKLEVTEEKATQGKMALKITTRFPANVWSNAYVEFEKKSEAGLYLDFSKQSAIEADVYLPVYAPQKMKAKFVFAIGQDWSWTEARDGKELEPGSWTTIRADLTPASTDWKIQMTPAASGDVRKIGIRVESASPEYEGEVFIDNIRLLPKTK